MPGKFRAVNRSLRAEAGENRLIRFLGPPPEWGAEEVFPLGGSFREIRISLLPTSRVTVLRAGLCAGMRLMTSPEAEGDGCGSGASCASEAAQCLPTGRVLVLEEVGFELKWSMGGIITTAHNVYYVKS